MTANISTDARMSRYETEVAVCEYIHTNRKCVSQDIFKKFEHLPRTVLHDILDELADAQIIFIVHDGTYRWQCEQTLEGAKLFIRCRYQRGN